MSCTIVLFGCLENEVKIGPSGKTRTARYIPVRQLTGMRTGRYRAVPLRSGVDEEEEEKKKKKKRRRSTSHRPSDDSARGSPASHRCQRCPSTVAACAALTPSPAGFFLPTRERVRGDVADPRADRRCPSDVAACVALQHEFFSPRAGKSSRRQVADAALVSWFDPADGTGLACLSRSTVWPESFSPICSWLAGKPASTVPVSGSLDARSLNNASPEDNEKTMA
ncbi:hypothetical protein BHE74_00012209 [Ensete ventricosum]|nr:hypothetical protein GW17_00002138 [Ensete ventricosum]RWW79499.1 hypothetical protein BHE74_00012209 [Ensete ventricosum]